MKKLKFGLQERLAEDTDSYTRDPVEKYVEYRREQGDLVEIGNLLFDAEAMLQPFVCDTRLCIPAPGKGGKRRGCQSCCVVYAPRISERERDRIEEILPGLQARFPHLAGRMEKLDGYYEWDDSYDRLLTKDGQGRCVFLTPDTREFGFHACTIHAHCLERQLSEHLYKPSACVMFPLFILDAGDADGTILVTSHNKEVMTLGESEENFHDIDCMKANPLAREPLYRAMQGTLVTMFGRKAWDLLDRALGERTTCP